MAHCVKCGTYQELGAQFCGSCGARTPAMASLAGNGNANQRPPNGSPWASSPTSPASSHDNGRAARPNGHELWATSATARGGRSESWDRRRWLTVAASAAAFVLIVGAIFVHVGVRRDLSRTRTQLASTSQTLEQTASDLESTKSDLKTTQDNLTETESERDSLSTENEVLQGKIQGVQGSLNDARSELGLQAGQISTLKTCLNGVAIALRDVLNNDYYGAASALQSVQGPCNEAFRLL